MSNRTFGSVIKVYRRIHSRCVSKTSTSAANFTSSNCDIVMILLQLLSRTQHLAFFHIEKKSGIFKFKEKPYLGFPLGVDADGGVRNRIFRIHLQTEAGVIPVPV